MAGKRIEIMDIRQMLLLKQQGKSNRKVAQALHMSRNTVNEYWRLFESLDVGIAELLELDDAAIYERFTSQSEKELPRYQELAKHFTYFQSELRKVGCTLLELWRKYRESHPNGYGYTQFVYHYQQWAQPVKGSMRLEHKAGEQLFVDYAGKHLHIVDKASGALVDVEVFVAILPCSQYVYVEASASQKREDFIASLRRCLEFYGGVPQAIVCDNLKSGVSKAHKYEPVINHTLKDFGVHYGCIIDPARPYHPQDKALVESTIKLIYQRIYYLLSNQVFHSIQELNAAIAGLLKTYNSYLLHNQGYSRYEQFISDEKAALNALPNTPYELRTFSQVKVHKTGYVYLSQDKHYYSVPHRYLGKYLRIGYTNSIVEIFYNHERVCIHKRIMRPGGYTTQQDHLTPSAKAYSLWSVEHFERQASNIGVYCHRYISRLISQYDYPNTAYKQCMGILQLAKSYGNDRMEKACERALQLSRLSYRSIDSILKSGIEQLELFADQPDQIPEHENIRGADYYNYIDSNKHSFN